MSSLKRNVTLLYAFRGVRTFLLVMPILVPFFQENGLSQTEIYLLESVWALTILFLEVPSGYLADRFTRKSSIVAGAAFSTLGFVIYAVASSFVPMLLAQAVFGLGYSLISGADSAMAYDSLVAADNEPGYRRFEAYSQSVCGVTEAAASVLGGFLAVLSLRTPIVVQAGVYALLVPLALMLKEPKRIRRHSSNPFKDVLNVTKYALHGHAEVKWLIFYGAAAATLTHTMVWLTQPYYQLVGLPLAWFGVVWALQLLGLALFSSIAHKYEGWVGKKNALVSFFVIGVVSYLVLGFFPSLATLPVLLGFYFVRGVHIPILQDYVNQLVESDIRATVLSVKNLAQKLLYATLGPIVGVVFDAYSLQAALIFSAFVYGVLGLIVLLNMRSLLR